MSWHKLSEVEPCAFGEQADVIFGSPEWGWPLFGVVTNYGTLQEWKERTKDVNGENWPGDKYKFMVYDQINDRYQDYDYCNAPTIWMYRPKLPKE